MKNSSKYKSVESAGHKKRPELTMQGKNAVQVFSCIHAVMGWKSVMNEPHLH
jgi:hypothetical protein